jgi:hypothetical protein
VRDNHTPLSLPQEHSESIKKKEEVLVWLQFFLHKMPGIFF